MTSVDTVMRTGYRHGDRVLRPATVGVVDPAAAVPADQVPDDVSSLTDEAPDE